MLREEEPSQEDGDLPAQPHPHRLVVGLEDGPLSTTVDAVLGVETEPPDWDVLPLEADLARTPERSDPFSVSTVSPHPSRAESATRTKENRR